MTSADALQTLWDAIPENARGDAEDDAHAELREFIANMLDEMPPSSDPVLMRLILAEGKWGEDRSVRGKAVQLMFDSRIAYAIGWECVSCRTDVGWATSEYARRFENNVDFHVECGHCGWDAYFDENGNYTERD
jgi:hypothetical protein